jgi:hypothetical protein
MLPYRVVDPINPKSSQFWENYLNKSVHHKIFFGGTLLKLFFYETVGFGTTNSRTYFSLKL